MAHTMSSQVRPQSRPPLDPNRIAAGAGAIALNTTALLLLLVPLSLPERIASTPDRPPQIHWIEKFKPIAPPRPIELPVVPKPITQSTPPVALPQPLQTPQVAPTVEAQPGDTAIVETGPTGPVTPAVDSIGAAYAQPGAQLQALMAPPPRYPRDALRDRLTGTVMLEILVGIDGRPVEVRIVRSSGHRELDRAAERTVMTRWTFQPAMRDGQPVQALGRVPIEFKLD